MSKTILVSNRLPIRVTADGAVERTTGGLASALAGLGGEGAGVGPLWVGWPGAAAEELADVEDWEGRCRALGIVPVALEREALAGYYDGYSNGTLWPLLHGMPTRATFDPRWFEAYAAVNARFAEAVLAVAEAGDTVWVHDFHLFLLPRLLRERNRGLRIGFFLHTPFPSSELFRIVPERAALLEGLLGADRIGFHTYAYLRHFRSSVLRVLGLESEIDAVRRAGHVAGLGVHPIGHDHTGFAAACAAPEYSAKLLEHAAQLGPRQLVLSVERLDYTKGVPQKIAAIRRFLERHPELLRRAVFALIAVPSRQGIGEYDDLTEEVQREVGALNGRYGTLGHVPVQFLHRGFPQSELAALYALADVCLVTPLVDGMNLVAKEYVACKWTAGGARPGVLVLSEFAGAAQEMSEALLVNPYDVDAVADTLAEALALPAEERFRRTESMGPRLVRNDAAAWARGFLAALPEERPDGPLEDLAGLAAELALALAQGRRVALFLDYDGTLRSFTAAPADAVPDAALRTLLGRLARAPNLDLAIVSGRPSDFLERHLGDLPVTLVAEHGYRCKRRGGVWGEVEAGLDLAWKDDVWPILQQAADLTPGATLEEKRSALVWHYRRAEPEFGAWRARLLLAELVDSTANLPVVVHHGRKIVEVASQFVSKGAAVRRLCAELRPDVALAAGDDQTDETMFQLDLGPTVRFHTVGVGEGPSRAQRRSDLAGLRVCLEALAEALQQGESSNGEPRDA